MRTTSPPRVRTPSPSTAAASASRPSPTPAATGRGPRWRTGTTSRRPTQATTIGPRGGVGCRRLGQAKRRPDPIAVGPSDLRRVIADARPNLHSLRDCAVLREIDVELVLDVVGGLSPVAPGARVLVAV